MTDGHAWLMSPLRIANTTSQMDGLRMSWNQYREANRSQPVNLWPLTLDPYFASGSPCSGVDRSAKWTWKLLSNVSGADWSIARTKTQWRVSTNRFWIDMKYRINHVTRHLGAVSIRKTVLPGMAIPMLKIRRPNGRLIFNMEMAIRR